MPTPANSVPSLDALLHMLEQQPAPDTVFVEHIAAARNRLAESSIRRGGAPFLSVIMRTQGKRTEAFADALLCLAAQTDRDFELIVVTHNADAEARGTVEAVATDHSPLLPALTVRHTEGGSRAHPLNIGVEQARGDYLAFFDDDDLLFAHWVETFRMGAEINPGQLIHAVSGTQRVAPEAWSDGRDGFRTLTWSMAEYATEFDPLRNYVANHSPFMSIAFPQRLFSIIGFRFDETLEVCEDWEVIAVGASLLGMASIRELTSIYRRWEGGSSSYTEHSSAAWDRAERQLLSRLNSSPILLQAGSVERLRSLLKDENASIALSDVLASRSWRILGPARRAGTVARVVARRALGKLRRG